MAIVRTQRTNNEEEKMINFNATESSEIML